MTRSNGLTVRIRNMVLPTIAGDLRTENLKDNRAGPFLSLCIKC
ncbi:hypothetical protein SAMN04488502_11268 [Dendrosporobacter quercicolus]|uniref:Uncharacterized protein n=1 Tax=Dendrosporobacter quercicolus TaxID=146817 RepID=A0A1G9YVC2_9FIRM|nr:hypothetical protein SAMN04488502_11268 [Dendrosporobacter quercicolus]